MAGEQTGLTDLVEVLRAEQRRRWLQGEHVPAETYFEQHPELLADADVALRLVYNEVLLREESGDAAVVEQYVRRFPRFAAQLGPLFEVHRALESRLLLDSKATAVLGVEPRDVAAPPGSLPWPTLAGYEILGELGRGGMGVVYKARHKGLNRVVAVKMILAGGYADPAYLRRFRAEAAVIARLDHPNIVQIYDVGEQDGRPYFSLEFIDGGGLDKKLSGTPQPARWAAALIEVLAQAMHVAHQHNVLHRDLKPANILLGAGLADCVPKISDFGLAKQLDLDGGQTQSGHILGTPSYMAPEQAEGKGHVLGPPADVYALGAILYEMLTGRPPFKAATPLETLRLVLSAEPVPISRLHLQVPPDLETICLKCLHKEPQKRYASALALAEDLQRFLNDQPIRARRAGPQERLLRWGRRNPVVALLTGSIALLLVVVTAVSLASTVRMSRQLELTRSAQREGQELLATALLAQARASHTSRRPGQRFESLTALDQATKLARELGWPAERFDDLRNAAIAALALPDLQASGEFGSWPAGTFALDTDGCLDRYARTDRRGRVSVRRVADDTEIVSVPGYGTDVEVWPALSPDGAFLAVFVVSGQFKVWKLSPENPVAVINEPDAHGCAFSPDSKQVLYGCPAARELRLVDLGSGAVRRLPQSTPAHQIAFHPDGRHIALATIACGKVVVQVRDLDTGNVTATLPHPAPAGAVGGLTEMAWSPDGRVLASAAWDRIYSWDVVARTRFEIKARTGGLRLTFSHSGNLLAGSTWDGYLRLWDPHSGQEIFRTAPVNGLPRFSPDDRLLAGYTGGGTKLQYWAVAAGREYRTLTSPARPEHNHYFQPAISPDGRFLAAAAVDGLHLWDLACGKEVAHLPQLSRTETATFDAAGNLLTNGRCGGILRWPLRLGPGNDGTWRLGPPERLGNGVYANITQSPDGHILAIPNGNAGAVVLDLRQRPPRRVDLKPQADVRSVALSRDGRWAATGTHIGTGHTVKVWPLAGGAPVAELPVFGPSYVGFSPDGKWLVTTGGGCRLWEVRTWQEARAIGGGAFAFSPDGTLLAVDAGGGVTRLVDPATGREHARLEGPNRDTTHALTFGPDGTQLAVSSGAHQAVHVWDLRLIRTQLAAMGLDWEMPAYPLPAGRHDGKPLAVKVDFR